jgi:hypothetical protein
MESNFLSTDSSLPLIFSKSDKKQSRVTFFILRKYEYFE